MKKVLALVLASLLTISLVGCNDSKTNTPADGSSGSTNETETVTISYYGEGDAPRLRPALKQFHCLKKLPVSKLMSRLTISLNCLRLLKFKLQQVKLTSM